jgi:hypothetical protein
MNDDKLSRRTFVHNTSLAALGTVAASLTGHGCVSGSSEPAGTSKIDTLMSASLVTRSGRCV